MRTAHPLQNEMFANYLKRFRTGLKGVGRNIQLEIQAEIRSHIEDRVAQLEQQGSTRPVEDALVAFGEPEALSSQFVQQLRRTCLKIGPSEAKGIRLSRQRSA
jgi:hypothetical protein